MDSCVSFLCILTYCQQLPCTKNVILSVHITSYKKIWSSLKCIVFYLPMTCICVFFVCMCITCVPMNHVSDHMTVIWQVKVPLYRSFNPSLHDVYMLYRDCRSEKTSFCIYIIYTGQVHDDQVTYSLLLSYAFMYLGILRMVEKNWLLYCSISNRLSSLFRLHQHNSVSEQPGLHC